MSKINPEIYNHRPMFVRRFIVLLALLGDYGVMHFSDDVMLTVAAYFVAVTGLDVFAFYVLRVKSSDYADAEQLLIDDQTTLEGLDNYAGARRKIRMVSLTIGLLAGGVTYLLAPAFVLHVFCLTFLAFTILGLAVLKPHYRKEYPMILVRDDSLYIPGRDFSPGSISPEQAALAANGQWAWGPIKI